MLKKVFLNSREIPIPVPLKTLADAIAWVDETLVRQDAMITKITLGGQNVLTMADAHSRRIGLDEASELCFQVDSPRELAIQTLDAVRDLAHEVVKRLKPLAVTCWQLPLDTHLTELSEIISDLKLAMDLIVHINGMLDYTHVDMAPINGLARLIARSLQALEEERRQCDWRQCARRLLNRLEPYLKELVAECESLQIRVFSADRDDEPSSSSRWAR